MQTIQDFAGSTDMWSTSVGGHLLKVVNFTGFTVLLVVFEHNGGGSPKIIIVIYLYYIHVGTFQHCHIFGQHIVYNNNYDIHSGDEIEFYLGKLLPMYVC